MGQSAAMHPKALLEACSELVRLTLTFDHPADAKGTEKEKMPVYRRVRDEIKEGFYRFYINNIKNEQNGK